MYKRIVSAHGKPSCSFIYVIYVSFLFFFAFYHKNTTTCGFSALNTLPSENFTVTISRTPRGLPAVPPASCQRLERHLDLLQGREVSSALGRHTFACSPSKHQGVPALADATSLPGASALCGRGSRCPPLGPRPHSSNSFRGESTCRVSASRGAE